jgi:hypothetical protein
MRTVPTLFVLGCLLASAASVPADEPSPPATGIAALAWLEGAWRTAGTDDVWEACYTSADGGEIVSATKRIEAGKTVLFDFERFREEDGKVVLTPFPYGKASVDFPVASIDPRARVAVFSNPEHDFPQRLRYERTADDRLKVTLSGDRDGRSVGFAIEFVRKR